MDPERAVADFKRRRENYMRVYEPVDEDDGPHIKGQMFLGLSKLVLVCFEVRFRYCLG